MRNVLLSSFVMMFGLNAWSLSSSANEKYAVSFNYQMNLTNPSGTNPTSMTSFSVSPSLIRDDKHEFGGSLSYSVNKSENTLAKTTSEASTQIISGFYRMNLPIGDQSAKNPIIAYFGPQVGNTTIKAGNTSSSNMSAGGQVGLNMMVSQNVAINFHIFQFDTVFATDTQLLITQSVGIKYYF